MTILSTFTQNFADTSVMFECCDALLCSHLRDTAMEIWPGIEEIRVNTLYLNPDDLSYPPVKAMKRSGKIYLTLTLYENQFGERHADTRDFDRERVLAVVCGLYEAGFHAAAKKVGSEGMTLEQRQAFLSEVISEYAKDFDPTKSALFEVQPHLRTEKFYLDPNK